MTSEQPIEKSLRDFIITYNDAERWPLLEMESQACSLPLSAEDEQAIVLMDAVLNELHDEAAGLAAIQIGCPKRIFLLRNQANGTANKAYINPVVLSVSKEKKLDGEACLSLPGMGAKFKRPKSVTISYLDTQFNLQTETFTGFWARAIMHEMNHLDGVLITKHLEQEVTKQPRRTSFGMVLTPQKQKAIAARRAKAKRVKKARRHQKSIGR